MNTWSSTAAKPAGYWPAGTVYGTLLNFRDELDLLAPQMTQVPYKAPPKAPVLFVKTANTWSASGADVVVPTHAAEIEVGATIGMTIGPMAHISSALLATTSIASFVLMNDFSIPHGSFFRPPVKFKCLDGFLGVGTQQLIADQAGDPSQFKLEVRINGDLRQTVDFSRLVRSAQALLADVSEFMTLREGDVLMLGSNCLADGRRPLARVGDCIEISAPALPALGTLTNLLVGEAK
jgi:5-oxopent-3-ene-1,2,5-tricarboxylate decarboxylase/2-hydroxyhepta-2,4-diene-1,7-dioate isomerase